MCEYQNTYDDQKISAKQIKDSLEMLRMASSMLLETDIYNNPSFTKPPQPDLIRALNVDYQQTFKKIQSLSPAPQAKYQKLKSIVISNLNDQYNLATIKYQAYKDPKVLLVQTYGQRCYAIAQKMNLKDQALIDASRQYVLDYVANERKLNNQYEEWYTEQVERYEREIKQASNKSAYALDTLMFHWGNCAVHSLPDHEVFLTQLNPQKELFIKSKAACDY